MIFKPKQLLFNLSINLLNFLFPLDLGKDIDQLTKPRLGVVIPFSTTTWAINNSQIKVIDKLYITESYNQPWLRELILKAKYEGQWSISYNLAKMVYNSIINLGELNIPKALVCVPADPKRGLKRGYHLPVLIAKDLSLLLDVPVYNLLVKNKHTSSQVNIVGVEQRLKNLSGVFEINNNLDKKTDKLLNKTDYVWLIDDITTTGTTLGQCALALLDKYPHLKIDAVVVAR